MLGLSQPIDELAHCISEVIVITDPVCCKRINHGRAHVVIEYEGVGCPVRCQAEFERAPERYARPEAGEKARKKSDRHPHRGQRAQAPRALLPADIGLTTVKGLVTVNSTRVAGRREIAMSRFDLAVVRFVGAQSAVEVVFDYKHRL